jgi:hypothetical protein
MTVRYGIELRRLARTSCSTPVYQVTVIPAVRVQSESMIGDEAPPFGICWHVNFPT